MACWKRLPRLLHLLELALIDLAMCSQENAPQVFKGTHRKAFLHDLWFIFSRFLVIT